MVSTALQVGALSVVFEFFSMGLLSVDPLSVGVCVSMRRERMT